MLEAGQNIGAYTLVRQLGAGAFGEVWLARHDDLEVDRAMKIPVDPDYIKQLRREGRIQFGVKHPNIVETLELNTRHDPPFFVMEYVEGESLRQRLAQRGALPPYQALGLMGQVLGALVAAHAAGVVHCDLKPENILLTQEGRAKITDFGLGKVQADVTQSVVLSGSMMSATGKSVSGTYGYMSPEQQAGGEPDPRNDLYAVGIIGFEMLTGRRPSAAGAARALERSGIEPKIAKIIETACDDIDYRYADAGTMLADVQVAAASAAPAAAPLAARARPLPPVATDSPIVGAVRKLNDLVRNTLGPRARPVVLPGTSGPRVLESGSQVLTEFALESPAENSAVELLRPVALRTRAVTGDGVARTVVLAAAIFEEALEALAAGANSMALQRGIRGAAEAVVERLGGMKSPVMNVQEVAKVGALAAENDVEIGKLIASAMDKVGRDGVITVEEGVTVDTEIEVVNGMRFDRGYLSPQFITDPARSEAVLEYGHVLVYGKRIAEVPKLVPILEKVAKAGKPLLVIAEDLDSEILKMLVVNKLRGILKIAAVKAPGYGERRKAILGDIATLTGATPILEGSRVGLETLDLTHLGTAKQIIVTQDTTTLVEGAGGADALQARIDQIRKEIELTTSDYDREKLQERFACLAGGAARIYVGAPDEPTMKRRKALAEGALLACQAALDEGVLPGGGVALLRARSAVDAAALRGDEAHGASALRNALTAPLRAMLENAGFEPADVLAQLEARGEPVGFDILAGHYADMPKAGILDPAKVVRVALQNAAAVAALLIQYYATGSTPGIRAEPPAAPAPEQPEPPEEAKEE